MNDFDGASLALFRENRVLLIRRAYAPFRDYWTLPGGRREPGETALQCAIREMAEETGLSVFSAEPVVLIDIGEGRPFHLAVFVSDDFEGELVGSDEIADHAWVELDTMPQPVTPELPEVLSKALAVLESS